MSCKKKSLKKKVFNVFLIEPLKTADVHVFYPFFHFSSSHTFIILCSFECKLLSITLELCRNRGIKKNREIYGKRVKRHKSTSQNQTSEKKKKSLKKNLQTREICDAFRRFSFNFHQTIAIFFDTSHITSHITVDV
jgi:hypothetical protein